MKIVLVSLARRGGMVHFLAELANGLAPLGSLTVAKSSQAESSYFSRKIGRILVDTSGGPIRRLIRSVSPTTWRRLSHQLDAVQADVVHIVGVHEWNPMVALVCKRLRKPLVYTVHDPNAHPGAPWTIRASDWITARMADRIVVLTKDGRRQLQSRGFARREIRVIPHPIYTLFRRWRSRAPKVERTILYLGRIAAYKGLDVLIKAYAAARESLIGWRLIIAGGGHLPASSADLAAKDIEILNRYLSDKAVARLMETASMVVLPYTTATQSGVVALAQAFGVPVIATAVGGMKEMIVQGKTGILVPPGDIHALARAMSSLAGDPRRLSRMRKAAPGIAEKRWSPEAIARDHRKLYAEVIGERRGR